MRQIVIITRRLGAAALTWFMLQPKLVDPGCVVRREMMQTVQDDVRTSIREKLGNAVKDFDQKNMVIMVFQRNEMLRSTM